MLFATGIAIAVALGLSVFVGTGVAARPCGKAVIDDWYDNGTIDRSWHCVCLRDAIERLPDIARPYSPARDDLQRQLELELCEGSRQVTVSATLGDPRLAPGSDKSIVVSDDFLPWDFLIVGGVALGLAALVGVALHRQRRQRND